MPNFFNHSATQSDDPIATPTIAAIYLRQGLPQRALNVYRNLLRDDPDNIPLRRQMEELQERLLAEEAQMRETPEQGDVHDPALVAERQIALLTLWLDAARRRKCHVS